MNKLSRKILQVALISAMASPLTLLAADQATDDHNSHHPAPAQSAATPKKSAQNQFDHIQENMQARMLAMQNTSDPETRQAMMMAQMADMSSMMAGMTSGCPMAQGMMGGGKGGMMSGMMGGGKGGMMNGQKGGMMGDNMPGKPAK